MIWMRVGIEAFTLREQRFDSYRSLNYVKSHGLDGLQGGLGSVDTPESTARCREVKAYADSLGLYTEIAVDTVNPLSSSIPREEHLARLRRQIENAASVGWHELHTWCGGPDARARTDIAWHEQMRHTERLLRDVAPLLRDHGCRLNIEPKGGVSTFDAVRLIEAVGPDVVGVCLDTANTLCFAEEPTRAARRVAPYVHMTHCKDAIVWFHGNGIRRQVRPIGAGVLNWPCLIAILAEHSPELTLSIEDHKWLYDIPIFDPVWIDSVEGLSAGELGETAGLAWQCGGRIAAAQIEDPEAYEAVPWLDQMETRVVLSRDTLRSAVARLSTGM